MNHIHRQTWPHTWGKVIQDSHWCLIEAMTPCGRMGSFATPFLLPSAQPVPTSPHILVNQNKTKTKGPAVAHKTLLQIRIKACQGAFWLVGYFSWVLFVYLVGFYYLFSQIFWTLNPAWQRAFSCMVWLTPSSCYGHHLLLWQLQSPSFVIQTAFTWRFLH